ncbi:MAG: FG-GAP repeat protein, partial [Acidimicrobiales bacterium]|nr:FG-GAP repeat protein [Acidimicrobiales bacterium]
MMIRALLKRAALSLLLLTALVVALGDAAQALGYIVGRPGPGRFGAQMDFVDPALTPFAPSGEVLVNRSIDSTTGEVVGLANGDRFGEEVAAIGDVNGDGVTDIAVGARFHEDVGIDRGGVWVLLMRRNGTVLDSTLISETEGGLRTRLDNVDYFGSAVAPLGDVNGDGIPDIAVGAFQDDTAATNAGAVYVLNLNSDGSVKGEKMITQGLSGFAGPLAAGDGFGRDIANIGDVDGDGIDDIAVG